MWEKILDEKPCVETNFNISSSRLKVPGGWIVRTIVTRDISHFHGAAATASISQTFIADAAHEWKLAE